MTIETTADPGDENNEDDPKARQELLLLSHKIRKLEHNHAVAKKRRKWGNFAVITGPIAFTLLYGMWWITWIPPYIAVAVTIPVALLIAALAITAVVLKRDPGGPEEKTKDGHWVRADEGNLVLAIDRVRDERKHKLADTAVSFKVRRITYKEDAFADIDQLRKDSKRYRRVNNTLQGILIIGSLAATAAAGVAAQFAFVPWLIMTITFTVSVSSGFMGYFKYKERSFYLQQTADSIEEEWEAYEVGVDRYKHYKKDKQEEALAEFVERVHSLKSEQKKRQQNLEQPPEIRGSTD